MCFACTDSWIPFVFPDFLWRAGCLCWLNTAGTKKSGLLLAVDECLFVVGSCCALFFCHFTMRARVSLVVNAFSPCFLQYYQINCITAYVASISLIFFVVMFVRAVVIWKLAKNQDFALSLRCQVLKLCAWLVVCFLCCSCVCDAPVCQLPVDIVFYCFGFNFTGKQAK